MRHFLCLLVPCSLMLLLSSCAQAYRQPDNRFSADEQAAIDFIAKDPAMKIVRIERQSGSQLLVTTLQGNQQVFYRVNAAVDADAVTQATATQASSNADDTSSSDDVAQPSKKSPKDMIHLVPLHLPIQ